MALRAARLTGGRNVRRRVVGAWVALSVTLAGCATDLGGLPTYWNFENRTEAAITVVWERESGERIEVTKLEPGESLTVDVSRYGDSRDVCDDGEFVFTTPSDEVVTRGHMNCSPWVIETSPGQS